MCEMVVVTRSIVINRYNMLIINTFLICMTIHNIHYNSFDRSVYMQCGMARREAGGGPARGATEKGLSEPPQLFSAKNTMATL